MRCAPGGAARINYGDRPVNPSLLVHVLRACLLATVIVRKIRTLLSFYGYSLTCAVFSPFFNGHEELGRAFSHVSQAAQAVDSLSTVVAEVEVR